MACSHLFTQIIFWRSKQYLGALDALQGDHDNSTQFSTILVYMTTNAESLGWYFGHRRRRYRITCFSWRSDNLAHAPYPVRPVPGGVHR